MLFVRFSTCHISSFISSVVPLLSVRIPLLEFLLFPSLTTHRGSLAPPNRAFVGLKLSSLLQFDRWFLQALVIVLAIVCVSSLPPPPFPLFFFLPLLSFFCDFLDCCSRCHLALLPLLIKFNPVSQKWTVHMAGCAINVFYPPPPSPFLVVFYTSSGHRSVVTRDRAAGFYRPLRRCDADVFDLEIVFAKFLTLPPPTHSSSQLLFWLLWWPLVFLSLGFPGVFACHMCASPVAERSPISFAFFFNFVIPPQHITFFPSSRSPFLTFFNQGSAPSVCVISWLIGRPPYW